MNQVHASAAVALGLTSVVRFLHVVSLPRLLPVTPRLVPHPSSITVATPALCPPAATRSIAKRSPRMVPALSVFDFQLPANLTTRFDHQTRPVANTITHSLKAALMHPRALIQQLRGSIFPIIWDSGASVCLSFNRDDFVGPLEKPTGAFRTTECVGTTLEVEGVGHVAWTVTDSTGMLRTLKLKALYVPKSKVCLLSISTLLQCYPDEQIMIDAQHLVLSGNPCPKDGRAPTNSVLVPINPKTNLPTSMGHHPSASKDIPASLNNVVTEVDDTNRNISAAEKEWLKWHFRLGHKTFRQIQFLMRSGVLAKTHRARALHSQIAKMRSPPKCSACQFAKAKRRSPPKGTIHAPIRDVSGSLKADKLLPGQEISVDHFVTSTLGRLPTGLGKSSDSQMYKGGCIFVDAASGFVHVVHQTSLNSHKTIREKDEFEFMCRDHGVIPQSYRADQHGSFTSKAYQDHLSRFHQTIQFAGTGGHHSNGISEKAIQDIMSCARTMLLHAAIHWPEVSDAQLWPLAVDHAVRLHNHMPRTDSGLSPADIFTKQRWPHAKFHDLHVWGCPVYVLDKRIADGKKIPRFQPRSTRHINLGFSSQFASTVPLLLNPNTGRITAQFNVVFDDFFTTVTSTAGDLPALNSPEWMNLFQDSVLQFPSDAESLDDVDSSNPPPILYRDSTPFLDSHDIDTSPYVPHRPVAPSSSPLLERESETRAAPQLPQLPTTPRPIL